jgi:hypothetical protein
MAILMGLLVFSDPANPGFHKPKFLQVRAIEQV